MEWTVYIDDIIGEVMVTNGQAEYKLEDAMNMLDDFLRLEVEQMDMKLKRR
jgi:hypothetical protein